MDNSLCCVKLWVSCEGNLWGTLQYRRFTVSGGNSSFFWKTWRRFRGMDNSLY
ncbi:unnamed protein product [Meloidogyne enterolobii]|uniref:Uncharacterized protein n=1 Tax=Meloidogyne enterolobii TaxID=390850 RepID=A0ACB0YQQ2_MELEN